MKCFIFLLQSFLINIVIKILIVPTLYPSIPLQALLVLHQPETIELWNPDTPMDTFWDIRYWFNFGTSFVVNYLTTHTSTWSCVVSVLILCDPSTSPPVPRFFSSFVVN